MKRIGNYEVRRDRLDRTIFFLPTVVYEKYITYDGWTEISIIIAFLKWNITFYKVV